MARLQDGYSGIHISTDLETDVYNLAFERLALIVQIGYSDVFRLNPLRNPALLAAARSCDPEYWRVARDYTDAARGHVWLALLAVDPVYQGRGVGLRLLRWGCERADRMGLQVALVAAPTAVGMYDREGFEEVTKVRLGPCFDLAMVRRAKTRME